MELHGSSHLLWLGRLALCCGGNHRTLMAKENVVSTFGIVFGFAEVAEDGAEYWNILAGSMTALASYSFLVFNLLCAPCFCSDGSY